MRRTERGLYFSAIARITLNTPFTLPSVMSEDEKKGKEEDKFKIYNYSVAGVSHLSLDHLEDALHHS